MDKVRDAALKAVFEVLEKGAYTNIAINNLLKETNFSPLERRFITEIVYGTVKNKNTLEWIRDRFVSKKKIEPWINYIILTGIYQLIYLDKVPVSAACNESVSLAKKYGNPGSVKFVNGVLRNIARNLNDIPYPDVQDDPVLHISVVYSHPKWLVKRWVEEYGIEETIALCRHNNSRGPNTIRVNTLKIQVEELMTLFINRGINVKKTLYAPEGLEIGNFEQIDKIEAFAQGLFIMQDEASMLVARCLNPAPNSTIIDGCAAPGSKTTHLAQLTADKSTILAFDIHSHKLKLIEQNARRLGINSIQLQKQEAQRIGVLFERRIDYLLLDVPCSGIGVLRRRADLRWRKNQQQIKELSRLQLEIIEGAAKCLKPGGVLVYSTCTMTHEENHDVVEKFLKNNLGFSFNSLLPYIPHELTKDPHLQHTAKIGFMQILPQRHNMDGFFIARIVRES
ncbi:MAG: 16S rRNA (cytosine(967)-C(5))-methyltransferase RsmB [Clostridia bacterium]|nr:16S rRNA (cytosine(967)-C(5))-methyltransferase RsmB [Clostridia bacterium]